MLSRLRCTLPLACWLLLIPEPAPAQKPGPAPQRTLAELSRSFQDLVARVDPAVVQIVTRGFAPADEAGAPMLQARKNSGSGVVVDPAGYIITNAHVVGIARRVDVLLPQAADAQSSSFSPIKPAGKLVSARVVGFDREADIAVLKIDETSLPFLPLDDGASLRQGHLVFAFGSPFGLENSVTMGVISSTARQVRPEDPMIYLQTDASINPGNSGGPLVDAEGRLVGINTFIVASSGAHSGIGFAVPSSLVRSVYEQIREHGRVRRGQIGIQVQTITPGLAQALQLPRDWGVMVADVLPGGAAQAADLQVKDVLLTANGKTLENGRQFGLIVYQSAGQTISVDLLRDGERLTRRVAVLERPKDPERILSLVTGADNLVSKLGIVAVNLDERVTPLLPPLRRLSGVVVAGLVADLSSQEDSLHAGDVIYAVNNTSVPNLPALRQAVESLKHGQPVAVQIERSGQMQFLLLEIE